MKSLVWASQVTRDGVRARVVFGMTTDEYSRYIYDACSMRRNRGTH